MITTADLPEGCEGPVELPSGHQIFWCQLPDGRFHAGVDLWDVNDDTVITVTGRDLNRVLASAAFMTGQHCANRPASVYRWELAGRPGRIEVR